MTRERLEEYLERLRMETLFLNEKIAILRFLKEERWKNPKFKNTTHLSRAFFYFIEQALQTDLSLRLINFMTRKVKEV